MYVCMGRQRAPPSAWVLIPNGRVWTGIECVWEGGWVFGWWRSVDAVCKMVIVA